MQRRRFGRSLLAAAASSWVARSAFANKAPIRLVVPYPPGGGNDLYARRYSPVLSRLLNAPVIVDNRSGASGSIGTEQVVRAAPDGHTVLYAASSIAINPAVFSVMSFDAGRDLLPVSQAISQPQIMVVHKNQRVTSFSAFLQHARASKSLAFGSAGAGSISHLTAELLFKRANVAITGVPFRGSGDMMTSLMGGHIQVAFVIPPLVRSFIEQGTLVPLATTGTQRIAQFPDVPTLVEHGYPDMVADQWHGFFMPAETPMDVATSFYRAISTTLKDPAVAARIAEDSATVVGSIPAEFKAYFLSELRRWKQVVSEAGIKPSV